MKIGGKEFLTEVSGYKQAGAQRRWCDAQGIPYVIGRDGFPRVNEDHVFGAHVEERELEPDFDSLKCSMRGNKS